MAIVDLKTVPIDEFFCVDMPDMFARDWFKEWVKVQGYSTKNQPFARLPERAWAKRNGKGYVVFFTSPGQQTHLWMVGNMKVDPVPVKTFSRAIVPSNFTFSSLAYNWNRTGWDPEIFVEDDKGLVPAFNFLPHKSKGIYTGAGGRAYYDGFQAEFTTPPETCHGYGFDHLRSGLLTIQDAARAKFPKAKLSLKSVFRIPDKVMKAANEEYVALGCKPSQNAYGVPSFKIEDSRMLPFRVAGGHIHFELSKRDVVPEMVKAMDLFLAIPCVAIFDGVDDPLRREFYGRAGEYRKPAYGLEYRTLSNAWLCDPQLGHGIMDLARQATKAHVIPNLHKVLGTSEKQVQEIINFCDVKSARTFIKKNWEAWENLMGMLWSGRPGKAFHEIIFGGVGAGFPDYANIENNWALQGSWGTHSDHLQKSWAHHSNKAKYSRA